MVSYKILYIHINWLESQCKSLPSISKFFLRYDLLSKISNKNSWDFTSLLTTWPSNIDYYRFSTEITIHLCAQYTSDTWFVVTSLQRNCPRCMRTRLPLFLSASQHQNRCPRPAAWRIVGIGLKRQNGGRWSRVFVQGSGTTEEQEKRIEDDEGMVLS